MEHWLIRLEKIMIERCDVSFSDFSKLDLRMGKVLSAEDHPQADRLYILKVDIGDKIIQLVAGIKPYYQREELLGRMVVVVVNLEPRVLRGIESQGMLLAAQSVDTVSVLTCRREVVPGSKVK